MLNKNYLQGNTYFVDNIKEIYPETGNQWLLDLPIQLKRLSRVWDFELDRVMPKLSYSFVALVNLWDKKAIIKIAPLEQSLANETLCLSCFQKDSPEIFHFDEKINAVLMEYIYPGESLKNLVRNGQDDKATQIICKVIRELRFQTLPTKHSFIHLSELAKDLDILHGHFDKNLLDKAIHLFDEMTADRSNDIVLHGDLHHDNILSSNDNWKIIDPHGYIGDPVAEVGAMIRNPYDCFPGNKPLEKILKRRLSILKDELPDDFDRIKAWCYCISVLSVAWTYEGFKKVTLSDIELIHTLNRVCF
jgi:streptomycin 6-kinase